MEGGQENFFARRLLRSKATSPNWFSTQLLIAKEVLNQVPPYESLEHSGCAFRITDGW